MSKIKDTIEDEKRFADKELESCEPKGYEFDKVNHIHKLDGKNLNGITTILSVINKPALIQWSANMAVDFLQNVIKEGVPYAELQLSEWFKEAKTAHRKKKEKAGDIGTAIHEAVEKFIKEGLKKNDDELVQKCLNNFISFAKENKVKFLESEKNLYSRKHWLGGIVDFICEIDGEVWVGDIKTASGIYPENFLQMAGYQIMIEEMGLYKDIKGHIVVNLKKDGNMEVKKNCEVDSHREAFISAVNLYRCLNNIK